MSSADNTSASRKVRQRMKPKKKSRTRRPLTMPEILKKETGDVERMHTIAKALDEMGTERMRVLALAFFVHRYDDSAAERLYLRHREELEKLRSPGHDY